MNNLILERGILGENKFTSKKIFCYAMFLNEDEIKIFTYELAPFQKW
jgi:hypothetical protein